MNLFELDDFINEQIAQGALNIEELLIEKYRRYAFPYSAFILTIIGLTLSVKKSKGGTWMHVGLGILLSFAYIFFMKVSNEFAINGSTDPLLAVWLPNIIFTGIAAILYVFAPK